MSESFAKINDVAPSSLRNENQEPPRLLLSYVRCFVCHEQIVIQTCAIDTEQRCKDHGDVTSADYPMHTHILCKCGEYVFSGVVSFRTTRDTDSFNVKRKLTWEDKKRLFASK